MPMDSESRDEPEWRNETWMSIERSMSRELKLPEPFFRLCESKETKVKRILAWLGEGHDPGLDTLVQIAAKLGNMKVLGMLRDAGLWDPRHCADLKAVIQAVENVEGLMKLLSSFDLQMSMMDGSTMDPYKEQLMDALRSEKAPGSSIDESYATLVANFIKVRSAVADDIMEAIVDKKQLLLHPDRETVSIMPEIMDFPKHLGTMFITRKIEYSKDKLRYIPTPTPDCDSGILTLVEQEQELKFQTSKLSKITFAPAARIQALTPVEAHWFAFVYGHNPSTSSSDSEAPHWLSTGGYLYLDKDWKPVSLNSINFVGGPSACLFGKCHDIELPYNDKDWRDTTLPEIKEKGATQFMWVVPDRAFPQTSACGAVKPAVNRYGGFAYFFPSASAKPNPGEPVNVKFFPLDGFGVGVKLVDRGMVGWGVNAAQLAPALSTRGGQGENAEEAAAERASLRELGPIITGSQFKTVDSVVTLGRPVKFAKVLIPGALHPNLLHAIATAPRSTIRRTLSAKAIVGAASREIMPFIMLDMFFEIVSAVLLWRIIWGLRYELEDPDDHDKMLGRLPSHVHFYLGWLGLLTSVTVVREVTILKEHWSRGWWSSYLSLSRVVSIVNMCLSFLMVACTVFSMDAHVLRILSAFALSGSIMKLLLFLRMMEFCHVGLKIAPILASLKDAGPFFVVVLGTLSLFVGLFWGLSDTNKAGDNVFVAMYRLGFLNDFEMTEDVTTSSHEAIHLAEVFAFGLTTFLISVALMNIFIGMFTTSFDHHSDRVAELFVEARATFYVHCMLEQEGLRKLLCCRRDHCRVCCSCSSTRMVWFCYNKLDQQDGYDEEKMSIRGEMRRALAIELRGNEHPEKTNSAHSQLAEIRKEARMIRVNMETIRRDLDEHPEKTKSAHSQFAEIRKEARMIRVEMETIRRDLDELKAICEPHVLN